MSEYEFMFNFVPAKPSVTFRLALVRGIDEQLSDVETKWGPRSLNCYAFSHFIAAFIHHVEGHTVERELPADPSFQAMYDWERRMFTVFNLAQTVRDLSTSIEIFHEWDPLLYSLFGVFCDIVGGKKEGTMVFHDFRHFVLNITVGGRRGLDENEVKTMSLSRATPCKTLYRMTKIGLVPEDNLIVASTINTGEHPAEFRFLDFQSLKLKQSFPMKHSYGAIMSFENARVECSMSRVMSLFFVSTNDSFVRVYDYERLRVTKAAVSFENIVTATRFLPNNRAVAFGDSTGCIHIISLTPFERLLHSLEVIHEFKVIKVIQRAHEGGITCMTRGRDDEILFCASEDGTISCVDLTGKTTEGFHVTRTLTGHRFAITSMVWNAYYMMLISCGGEPTIRTWTLEGAEVEAGTLVDSSNPYKWPVTQVATCSQKPMAVSMDVKGNFKLWDIRVGRAKCTVTCEPELTQQELMNLTWVGFAMHPTNYDVVSPANRKAYVLEYDTAERDLGLVCHEGPIGGAAFDPRSRTIITAAKTEVQIWNAENAQPLNKVREIVDSTITSCLILKKSGALVLGTGGGNIKVVSLQTFSCFAETVHGAGQGVQDLVELPPAGQHEGVVALAMSGHVEVEHFDFKKRELIGHTILRMDVPVRAASVSCLLAANGETHILLGELDNSVTIWRFGSNGYSEIMQRAVGYPSDRMVMSVVGCSDMSCFVCVDERGWFSMWALDAEVERTWILCRWQSPKPTYLAERPKIIKMAYFEPLHLLYAADECGTIIGYDVAVCLNHEDWQRKRGITFADVPSFHDYRGSLTPKPIIEFDAHPESTITVLLPVYWPYCLITGSDDCRVLISTTGGNPVSFLVRDRVGEHHEEQPGVDFSGLEEGSDSLEKYNDLPEPYGSEWSVLDERHRREKEALTSISQAELSSKASGLQELWRDEHKHLAAAKARATRIKSLPKAPDFHTSIPVRKSVVTKTKEKPMALTIARDRDGDVKAEYGLLDEAESLGRVIDRSSSNLHTIKGDDGAEEKRVKVIHEVPGFISYDRAGDASRPEKCLHAPDMDVDEAMYGKPGGFRALSVAAAKEASRLITTSSIMMGGGSPIHRSKKNTQKLPTGELSQSMARTKSGSWGSSSLLTPSSSPTIPLASPDGDKQPPPSMAVRSGIAVVLDGNSSVEQRVRRDRLIALMNSPSPSKPMLDPVEASPTTTTSKTPKKATPAKKSGGLNNSAMTPSRQISKPGSLPRRSTSVTEGMFQSATKRGAQKAFTTLRDDDWDDPLAPFPDGMLVPELRQLKGNPDHAKNHSSKAF